MGKVKIKRKSTLIDMTAMSDVTVLLLTFFMLTSTFLQKEPMTVITPSSVSEIKVPTANVVTILVSPVGQVFISFAGDVDSTYSSEKVRAEVLQSVVRGYNEKHSKKIELTTADLEVFSKTNMFGLALADMKNWLSLPQDKRDEFIDPSKNPNAGVPIDLEADGDTNLNEFQMWMRAAYNSSDANLQQAIKTGEGIAIKADKATPYSKVQVVMDNLQTLKMNKFSLMTALKSEDE